MACLPNKINEIVTLKQLADGDQNGAKKLEEMCWPTPIAELLIWFTTKVKERACITDKYAQRKSEFSN